MREQLGHVATSSPFSKSSYNKIEHRMVSTVFSWRSPSPKPSHLCGQAPLRLTSPQRHVRTKSIFQEKCQPHSSLEASLGINTQEGESRFSRLKTPGNTKTHTFLQRSIPGSGSLSWGGWRRPHPPLPAPARLRARTKCPPTAQSINFGGIQKRIKKGVDNCEPCGSAAGTRQSESAPAPRSRRAGLRGVAGRDPEVPW